MPKSWPFTLLIGRVKAKWRRVFASGFFDLNRDPIACKLVVWGPSLGFSGQPGSILDPEVAIELTPAWISPSE